MSIAPSSVDPPVIAGEQHDPDERPIAVQNAWAHLMHTLGTHVPRRMTQVRRSGLAIKELTGTRRKR